MQHIRNLKRLVDVIRFEIKLKKMIKKLIRIALIAVVAVVGYNYFLGDAAEKEQATKIVDGVKNVGSSIKDMVVNEKEKIKDGKYDKVLDFVTDKIDGLKAGDNDAGTQRKIEDLEVEKKKVEEELANKDATKEEKDLAEKALEKLMDKLGDLLINSEK